jgi:tetratricopeptide (TPR) repeat protein
MKLSLAMIVKDEAHDLAGCLGSVKGLVDEMVVIDTGSTDGTADIARGLGAKVESHAWTGDFAEARNASLSHCTGDWILVLDADEMLDPREHDAIRDAIQAADTSGAFGYRLPIRNYLDSGAIFGPGGSARPNDGDFQPAALCSHYIAQSGLRLFRNQRAPLYAGIIHESVEPWFERHGHASPELNAVIHHFGKLDSKRDMAKQPMYLALAKKEAFARPDDPIAHGNVLQEALILEDWPSVLDAARAYIRLKGAAPPLVHLGAAKALLALGRPEEAIERLANADSGAKPDAAALDIKAQCLQALGRLTEAATTCLRAIEADPGYTAPFMRLARLLDEDGDPDYARGILEAGLDQNPRDVRLWEALVGLSSKHRDPRVAKDAWHAIQAVPNGGTGIWHLLVAHVMKEQGDAEEAASVLDKGLVAFPGNSEMIELKKKIAGGQ